MNQTLSDSDGGFMYSYPMRIFSVVALGYINQALCIFGCVTNIVNMVVYYKLGLNESINLSLFALTISDFLSLATMIPMNCFVHLWLRVRDLSFDPEQISSLVTITPHVAFNRITFLLTASITFERCLCVIIPFKFKFIVTRKLVVIVIATCYFLGIVSVLPIYFVNSYAVKYYPEINQTRLGLVFTDDLNEMLTIYGPLVNVLLAGFPFVMICLCSAILAISLKRKTNLRQWAAAGAGHESISRKDLRICKMVVIVALLFIFCFAPSMSVQIAFLSDTGFNFFASKGKNFMAAHASRVVAFVLESTNSSMNIFIYYKFSTKFKDMFTRCFSFRRKAEEREERDD